MAIVGKIFQLIGSLSFILYGMKLMSDGIQKSASTGLQKAIEFMTQNRVMALLTGLIFTAIIQSSGATTVMTISFVNAELLSLSQAIAVIFGANIGTTVTAWIVALVGFRFDLTLTAIPAFGIGYFLTFFKKLKKQNLGEALMGFGLLFFGLEMLSSFAPNLNTSNFGFLSVVEREGALTVLSGFLFGLVITALLHSSSATTAILITMGISGVIGWEFAATAILGSNIGSTIDAVLAAIDSKLNAQRVAAVHVLFNIVGSIIALIFLHPFMALVNSFFVSGAVAQNMGTRIAIFHTLFNTINALIWLPFVNQVACFVEWLIKPKEGDEADVYQIHFVSKTRNESPSSCLIYAKAEIIKMSNLILEMFDCIKELFNTDKKKSEKRDTIIKKLEFKEDYADQMQEQLSDFLVKTSRLSFTPELDAQIHNMLSIVDNIENITDKIFELGLYLNRSIDGKYSVPEDDLEKLVPYIDKVYEFIYFVHDNLSKPMSVEDLTTANELEEAIDTMRVKLKKLARVRLEKGKGENVKAELLYIEMVRKLEHIGDFLFSISNVLADTSQ